MGGHHYSVYDLNHVIIMRMSTLRLSGIPLSEAEYVVYREACEYVAAQNRMLTILQNLETKKLENGTTE